MRHRFQPGRWNAFRIYTSPVTTIITCNRILFPNVIDDDDDVIREAKMKHAAKNIRKRKMTFDLNDVEKFAEHEDTRFIMVWFYYSDPLVIEYDYKVLETQFREWRESEDGDDDDDQTQQTLTFWIPAN